MPDYRLSPMDPAIRRRLDAEPRIVPLCKCTQRSVYMGRCSACNGRVVTPQVPTR